MKVRGTRCGFTLVELLAGVAIIGVLGALLLAAGWKVYENSSLAVSANNIRQLAAGSSSYLADNNYVFWRYRFIDPSKPPGVTWWFGFEPARAWGFLKDSGFSSLRKDPWHYILLYFARTPASDSLANPSSQSIDSVHRRRLQCTFRRRLARGGSPLSLWSWISRVRLWSLRRLHRLTPSNLPLRREIP